MFSALVPGRILRLALLSISSTRILVGSSSDENPGDVGPIWSSAIGGGEGSRGEDAGEAILREQRG